MSKVLLTIESVKIKDYLFSTNKLKVIRGASYLLDYLNQVVVIKILEKYGLNEENKDYLYVAAGNAKVIVDSEEIAKKIIKEVEEAYKKIAPGAKIAISIVKDNGEKIWDLIKASTDETANIKNKGFKEVNYHLPFIKKCDLCGTNPAEVDGKNIKVKSEEFLKSLKSFEETYKIVEEQKILKKFIDKFEEANGIEKEKYKLHSLKGIYDKLVSSNVDATNGICLECLSKIILSEEIKEDNPVIGFYNKFKVAFQDYELAETMEDFKDNRSFIGFMYADGDGLGDFLAKLNEKFKDVNYEGTPDDDYRKFLKEFSVTLDKVTKDSLIDAMKELIGKFPHVPDNKEKRHYGEFLIVGGDDVCGVFPAEIVLELSEKYQAIFEKKMFEFFNNNKAGGDGDINNITTSCGVVIAKHTTPMYLLFNQSLKLQKSAKKARYEEFKNKKTIKKHGYTDFQVIGSEGNVDIMDFRKIQKLDSLMERPYQVSDSENESKLKTFIKEIKEFKKCDFPRNKIRKFYELKKELNQTEALYEFVNLYGKLNENQRKMLKIDINDELNLEKYLKNIFDILEMYGFVSEEKEGNNENKL